MLLVQLLLLFLGMALLWFGADLIVVGAAALARRLGISELVIGLTVVAIGTSAPEFLVTMTAAIKDLPGISLANVVGSNVFNLGLILGAMALIRPIAAHRTIFFRDAPVLVVATLALLLMSWDGRITRWEGGLLLAGLIAYLTLILLRRPKALAEPEAPSEQSRFGLAGDLVKLALGLAAVAAGSHFLVESASWLALKLGVSQWIVGLTVVASGTSLPELVTCLAASVRGKNDMLLGNLIGSDIFNFSGVLGLTCLVRPLSVAPEYLLNIALATVGVLLVMLFVRTGWRISRLEGALLILAGLARWSVEFL